MNTILSEKEYQTFLLNKLQDENGYLIRNARSYDRLHAVDQAVLIQFLDDTQPKKMEQLRKV